MRNSYIPLTEKETKAVQNYSGHKHKIINQIANMDPMRYKTDAGVYVNITSDELEELIEDFVNLYAAIYKQGNQEGTRVLYRGTSTQEIQQLKKEKEIKNFLSTSISEEIARRFCQYKDAVIERINAKSGMPYLVMPKREDRENEKEILFAPFSKIVSKNLSGNTFQGNTYYDMEIEKEELPEIENGKLEDLKSQCLNGIALFQEQVKEYNSLLEEMDKMYQRVKIPGLCLDDRKNMEDKLDENREQRNSIEMQLEQYREKFITLLKGKCRQKEKSIDKQREEMVKQQEKEEEEKLNRKVEKLTLDINNQLKELKKRLNLNLQQLMDNSNECNQIATNANICYTQSISPNFLEEMNQIIQELEKMQEVQTQQATEEKKKNLMTKKARIEQIERALQRMSILIKQHKSQSIKELEYNLNTQTKEMLEKIKEESLQQEKEKISKEKGNVFQRIFGRNRIKEERIKNIETRMKLVKKENEIRNPNNKVEEMLTAIYECSYEYLDGEVNEDMSNMINKIRDNFGFENFPNEEELQEQAKEKTENRFLIPNETRKPIFRRRIKEIQEQTKRMEEKLKSIMPKKRKELPVLIDFALEMERKLRLVQDIIKEPKEEETQMKQRNIIKQAFTR